MNEIEILKLQNISKKFSKSQVLKSVDFSLGRGLCSILTGRNGCGKTTFLKIINGLLRPDKGELHVSKDLFFMPEVFKFPLDLTVAEFMKFYDCSYQKKSKASALDKIINHVSLASHKDRYVSKLSKGQGRRLFWGLTLLLRPKLLILDEPFEGLDIWGKKKFVMDLQNLKEDQSTILIATHEWSFLEDLVDDIYFLNQGELSKVDSFEKLLTLGDDEL